VRAGRSRRSSRVAAAAAGRPDPGERVDQYQYLLVLAACLLITLPLELVLGARVWRRPRRLLLTLLPVVVVYSVWDVLAIESGMWDYSERFTTGILLPFAMPLEELAFFVVIPICGLLTLEAVGNVLAGLRALRAGAGLREAALVVHRGGAR